MPLAIPFSALSKTKSNPLNNVQANAGQRFLIVNADDYGYFESVSTGIIEGAKAGCITATGIMANSPHFDACMERLQEAPGLDLGVHLNLTCGAPLSGAMADRLQFNNGVFPGKFTVINSLLAQRIRTADVIAEWRAQILRCINRGVRISFLNSHEHIHMLPGLFTATNRLARDFDIPHVRFSTPEWSGKMGISGIVRNTLMQIVSMANRGATADRARLPLLGMNQSGKLDIAYLKRALAALEPGKPYELMCHPGRFDPSEISDPGLRAYHHWEAELSMLMSPAFNDRCRELGVRLVGYRELDGEERSDAGR